MKRFLCPTWLSSILKSILPSSFKIKIAKLFTSLVRTKYLHSLDGQKFVNNNDPVLFEIMYSGYYERNLSAFIKNVTQSNWVAVDVGANFGWYTSLFSGIVTDGMVIAYEPDPGTFATLKKNGSFLNCVGNP